MQGRIQSGDPVSGKGEVNSRVTSSEHSVSNRLVAYLLWTLQVSILKPGSCGHGPGGAQT